MPENYITSQDERGNISIAEEVIGSIVGAAVSEIEGVAGMASTTGPDLAELLGKKPLGKGIRVSEEDGVLVIDAVITVRFGFAIAAVAAKVQNAIFDSLLSMTGRSARVNVHVCGVAFNKN